MITEVDVTMARRWFLEGWTGNLELAETIFSPELSWNGKRVGIAGPKRTVANRMTGFPGLKSRIEEQFAHDLTIVTRTLWSGTHLGIYNGIPPAGKRVRDILSLEIWHYDAGRVVEVWSLPDQVELFQQLAILPESPRDART